MNQPYLYGTCREGRGRIYYVVPRGRSKKLVAVLLIRKKFVEVPLAELHDVRAPRKK